MMSQKVNTWKVTTRRIAREGEWQECVFWYPTENAAILAAKGFRLGGRVAYVTCDTSNIR